MIAPRDALRRAGPALLAALVAFLPFARGVGAGSSLYFRDLSRHFFPLRLFAADGLRHGELRYWNPFVHEGIPTPFPPVSYPLDLLQALRPTEGFLTLLLVLHVPLAAAMFVLLARAWGASRTGALTAGLVYALGGFCLSSVNFYIYVQAMAWAPVVVLGLSRAVRGDARGIALGALATAVAVSTIGVEVVAQAIALGLLLAWPAREDEHPPPPARAALALLGALALALALTAPTIASMAAVTASSGRGTGFVTDVVLAHSVHPLTFVQVLVGDWYGELARVTDRWWGTRFFPRGFPYFLSLYLGPTAIALAAAGAAVRARGRARLLMALAIAVWVCLGRWGGLGPIVDHVQLLHAFRFPSKAFFTVHFVIALLAGRGVDALLDGPRSARRVGLLAGVLGGVLVLALAVPRVAPATTTWFVDGFFPPEVALPVRQGMFAHVLADAATGGALAVIAGAVALLAAHGRLRPALAAAILAALVAGDLLRAGGGLNPMVSPRFWQPSPEVAALVPSLTDGQRTLVCEPMGSAAYWEGRRVHAQDHELWTFSVYVDSLAPDANMRHGIPTALSEDMTSLVPVTMTLPEGAGCGRIGELLPRLRQASVGHVLSLDPLAHPDLSEEAVVRTARLAPAALHVYSLSVARSRVELAAMGPTAFVGRVVRYVEQVGAIDVEVECQGPTLLELREGWSAGWRAWVDGKPVATERVDARYMGLRLGAGHHDVRLRYRPRGVAAATLLAAVGALTVLALLARGHRT